RASSRSCDEAANKTARWLRPCRERHEPLGRALFGDRVGPVADLGGVGADVVEARQLRKAFEPEHALEERRRAITDGPAGAVVATRLRDQSAFDEVRNCRFGCDA